MTRENLISVTLASVGVNSDVVGRSVSSDRPTNLAVEQVFEIVLSQSGDLAVINTGAALEPFQAATTIPPEGSSIQLTNQALAEPTRGISYTLASDSNNNGQLDSFDQFHDFEDRDFKYCWNNYF